MLRMLWLWQFPQHLLGLFLIKVLNATQKVTANIVWYQFERKGWFSNFISGVSLGQYILLAREDVVTIKHENGHSVQSTYLGIFYLLTIGIYSAVLCNLWDRVFHRAWNSYDRYYWYYKTRWSEWWADELGGVDRDAQLCRLQRPEDSRFPAV